MKVNDKGIFIDGIDKKILRALMQDARTPILEIARAVGISGAAIHQRLRKLEKSGLLAGSKFIVNPKILGYTTMAFVGVYLDKAVSNPEAVKQLKSSDNENFLILVDQFEELFRYKKIEAVNSESDESSAFVNLLLLLRFYQKTTSI